MSLDKWIIFKDPTDKKWVVSPPIGVDPEVYEARLPNFKTAVDYWEVTHRIAVFK
jgi:hypothetical protein